jgi:hypothetical protein
LLEACSGQKDRVESAVEFLDTIVDRLNVPRRIAEPVRRIGAILPRLQSGRVGRFSRTNLYPLAAEVADLYAAAHGTDDHGEVAGGAQSELESAVVSAAPAAGNGGKRRRRRRR